MLEGCSYLAPASLRGGASTPLQPWPCPFPAALQWPCPSSSSTVPRPGRVYFRSNCLKIENRKASKVCGLLVAAQLAALEANHMQDSTHSCMLACPSVCRLYIIDAACNHVWQETQLCSCTSASVTASFQMLLLACFSSCRASHNKGVASSVMPTLECKCPPHINVYC